MKSKTLANLLIMTSIAFFTACSNKTAEVKKETLSIQEIQEKRLAYIKSLPLAKTYPVIKQKQTIQRVDRYQGYSNRRSHSNNIKVVSYTSYQPTVRQNHIYNSGGLISKIEKDAKKLLGIKYVWGATGPNKYDCSGFTQKIYRDAGIKIPRVSRHQAKVGQYIRYSNLQKGDMVFFDTKKRRTGKVSHVGIYLGNNNFIHASSGAKKIVIYNFNSKPYYKKRFLWGRRVIKSTNHFAMR
jgi:cell wall-associated NlpC family hydrolase